MAYSSGCCGGSQGPAPELSSPEDADKISTKSEHGDAGSPCASHLGSDAGCKEACCGDSVESASTKEQPPAAGCQSGCCGGETMQEEKIQTADLPLSHGSHEAHDESGPGKEPSATACQSHCCDEETKKEVNTQIGDSLSSCAKGSGCCASSTAVIPSKGNSSSRAPSPNPADCPTDPECSTANPCCDDSCLDRLALRACEGEKKPGVVVQSYEVSPTISRSSSSSCEGIEDGKPCGHHARVTRDTYADKLAALGCICRALLALGQESCCTPKKRSSIDRKRGFKRSTSPRPASTCSTTGMARTSVDSCCAGGQASGLRSRNHKRSHGRAAASRGCCDAGPSNKHLAHNRTARSQYDPCCADDEDVHSSHRDSADSCCDGNRVDIGPARDLEKGYSGYEHVVLSVSGMTCSGCEKQLQATLASLTQVRQLKTSLVLSRAEFDLDPRQGSLEDVMKYLERASQFKCEQIFCDEFAVDAIVEGNVQSFIEGSWPKGVSSIRPIDKKTVSIAYDPEVKGVRDLLEEGWHNPLVLAPPRDDAARVSGKKHVRHMGYMTLLSAALTIPVLVMTWAPLPGRESVYESVSFALATIVQFVIAGPFYPKALKSLVYSRVIEMDLLIVLSTSTAYIFSVVAYVYLMKDTPLPVESFFETSTLLVTLIMVGRWVASLARQKAIESISIRSLQTSTVTLVSEVDGSTRDIDTRLLQYGDVFKVAPDSSIPTDGTVIHGISEVDESMITGESRPVEKRAKSTVIAGTMNGSGPLVVRLSRLPGNNTIASIAGLVDEAKLTKPKIQDLADRVASYFVPVIVTITLVTFSAWLGVGINIHGIPGADAAIQAITYGITVLIVSCPCAIGLAVPMVIVIGTGVAAKHGVVFKSSETIEIAHKVAHVVFDKTGTLTQGKLSVTREEYSAAETIAPLLLGLVEGVKHPVSAAIAAHLRSKGVVPAAISNVKVLTGKGVEGVSASGQVLRAGNSRWLEAGAHEAVQEILAEKSTAFCFTVDNLLVAIMGLDDTIRDDARETVEGLQSRGISVHIVSGDDDNVVRALAAELRISDLNVRSRCTPSDKQAYIKGLLETTSPGHRFRRGRKTSAPVVMFCGDGTNDAVALTQASIGVAIQHPDATSGVAADVAKSAADVVLVTPRLTGVLTLINVSKQSIIRIWLNFSWSFLYNVFAILLAAGAFSSMNNVRIPPEFAGLGEIVSVLPVIAMAVQLRWARV